MELLWIWLAFLFVFGCCVGSFLNVVIYRLPRDKSIVSPASACPACGRHIRFYDNIPLISWLLLGAKCRDCRARISPQYFIIELLTGLIFVGVFILYFVVGVRCFEIETVSGLGTFARGAWLIYLVHIILLAAFLAASAIDLQLWVIPLSICFFVTAAGIIASTFGIFIIDHRTINHFDLLPNASATTAALAAGAAVGLAVSLLLLTTGFIKRSYESTDSDNLPGGADEQTKEQTFNHRLEISKEILFLLPCILCSAGALYLYRHNPAFAAWWLDFSQSPAIAGLLGSLWGYFIGGAVVWTTRILGTYAFGKEAMGLGDVHLMAAAGTIIGPVLVVVAFLVAPFFGLTWAAFQMFFKKTRQIPYGPFLSLAVFVVMIFHDEILNRLSFMLFR